MTISFYTKQPSNFTLSYLIHRAEIRLLFKHTTMTVPELRLEYKNRFGKNPFNGWGEAKLKEKLAQKESTIEKTIEEQINPVLEAARLENELLMREEILDEPAFKDGKAWYIINNEYVPYEEGKIVILEAEKKLIDLRIQQIKSNILTN